MKVRRLLSGILSMVMIIGLLPTTALATETLQTNENIEYVISSLGDSVVNSASVTDYGNDSYVILENGEVALQSWENYTQTSIEVFDATAIAMSGNILLVATSQTSSTSIIGYSVVTHDIYTIAELDTTINTFSLLGATLYYLYDGAVYSLDIATNITQTIYAGDEVATFYLYDTDILAYSTVEAQEEIMTLVAESNGTVTYNPYMMLFLNTGDIISKSDYDERTSSIQTMWGTTVSSLPSALSSAYGISLPFSDYPTGSHFTDDGGTCDHSTCPTTHAYVDSECNCKQYYNGVNLRSIQCYGFARMVYYRLFGHLDTTSSTTVISNLTSPSANTLQAKFENIAVGSHIRTGYGHSMAYLGCTSKYIYTYECNSTSDPCNVYIKARTWSEFASYLGSYGGISFVKSPTSLPAGYDDPVTTAPTLTQTSYVGGKTITLSADSGATIYYTTNGTTPTTSSTKYTGAFNIATSGSTTVQAMAVKSGYSNSEVKKYTIAITKLSTPTLISAYTTNGMLITLSADSGATIYYTTNGTTPTTSSTKYTGGFTITSAATIKAIATASGAATSSTLSKAVSVQAPDTPSASLFDTESEVAVGSAIQVVWDKQDIASTYETSLYLNDTLVETQTTSETLASFLLTEVGEYTVTVCASNFVGSSADSYPPVAVQSMGPVTLTLEDWDKTILSEIVIEYGETATLSSEKVERTGYDFRWWKDAQGTDYTSSIVMKENTVLTAYYTIQTYNIVFYDVDGDTALDTKKVPYGTAFDIDSDYTTPINYTIDEGYTFAGWHIEPQENSGTSLSFVDGNMNVVATQSWEDEELPVIIEVVSACRNEDGDYEATIKLTNWNQSITQGRLISTLKTSEGKLLTSDLDSVTLSVSETKYETVTLNYAGLATEFSAMVVSVTDDGYTGGAYSLMATSSEISAEIIWSEPSEWSTEMPTLTEDQKLETITQTRTRELQTTTASTGTLSGWTLYDTESEVGDWSSWSTTKPSSIDGREIETYEVAATYKTQYNYYGYKSSSGKYHFCPGAGKYIYGVTFSRIDSGWMDSQLTAKSMTSQTCSGSLSGCTHTGRITISTYYGSSPYYYYKETRQVQTGGGYYKYRYKDTDYTYYFYKYGEWSDWEDTSEITAVSSLSSVSDDLRISQIRATDAPVSAVDTETRTLYRYYTKVELNDPSAGVEDTSGEVYSVSGSLSTLETDFSGNVATVLVYQRTNSDPTAEALQYVGQTTIDEGNTYDFTFKPKSEPTEKTGDFVVSLALEGATRIINVDVIDAPKPTYQVTFMADGVELSTVSVSAGDTVSGDEIPEIPEKEGYTFVGWDTYTTNIDANLTINAVFVQKDCVIVKADFANNSVTLETQAYGDTLGTLAKPTATGKTFVGWYQIVNGLKSYVDETTTITENTIIYADWETEKYIVSFVTVVDGDEDADGNVTSQEIVVSEQEVAYGEAAQLPTVAPTEDGMVFVGWATDVTWWHVTGDMTVYPIFQCEETAEAPSVSTDIVNVLVFNSFTDDTDIYYNIETMDSTSGIYNMQVAETESNAPIGFENLYVEGDMIEITEDVKITMMAVGSGVNASETVEFEVFYENIYGGTDDSIEKIIYVDDIYASAGDIIDVPIYISSMDGIASCSLDLAYDSDIFQRISGTSSLNSAEINVAEVLSTIPEATGSVLLTTLQFEVLASAVDGEYTITITPSLKDSNDEGISSTSTVAFVMLSGDGYEVSGSVKSYNPTNATTITLSQDGDVKYTTTIEATTGSGQVEQVFTFASVSTGTYDLLVSKDGHTDYSIINLIVGSDAVDLTANSNSAISLITLLCGDINGDNAINQTDLNVLWLPANYNKTVETGGTDAALCDLNGDGSINQTDLNILWLPVNYNKSSITVNWES